MFSPNVLTVVVVIDDLAGLLDPGEALAVGEAGLGEVAQVECVVDDVEAPTQGGAHGHVVVVLVLDGGGGACGGGGLVAVGAGTDEAAPAPGDAADADGGQDGPGGLREVVVVAHAVVPAAVRLVGFGVLGGVVARCGPAGEPEGTVVKVAAYVGSHVKAGKKKMIKICISGFFKLSSTSQNT